MISMTLAKFNTVNPAIIDANDLEAVMKEGFMGGTITQLLSIARVKVLANKEIIIFVISFPRPKLLCKKITTFRIACWPYIALVR